jgi:hypothetical protein
MGFTSDTLPHKRGLNLIWRPAVLYFMADEFARAAGGKQPEVVSVALRDIIPLRKPRRVPLGVTITLGFPALFKVTE